MNGLSVNKFLLFIVIVTVFAPLCIAQEEFKPTGVAIGTLFFNYHYDFTRGTEKKSTFEIERAYLGYRYDFSKSISARILLDIGYNDNAYTAFIKNAGLDWKIVPKMKLTAGIFSLKQFNTQETFWGYRYIMKTFAAEFNLGPSADLGINLEYELNNKVTFNAFVLNGEGYKSLQDKNGTLRIGGNTIVKPVEGLILKIYYDRMAGEDKTFPEDTTAISNIAAFAGYTIKDKFRLGIEYNHLENGKDYKTFAKGYAIGGISIYGTYIISPRFELLARYDNLKSNTPGNSSDAWNLSGDGSLMLGGIQFHPVKGVNIALNYRTWLYKNPAKFDDSELYLNLGLFF